MPKPQVHVGVSYTRFAFCGELCELMYNNDQSRVRNLFRILKSITSTMKKSLIDFSGL